jgi:hypothetical protein
MQEADLANEIAAFIQQKSLLRERRSPPWVVFADGKFQRAFDDYASAVDYAIGAGLVGRFLVRDLYAEPAHAPFVFARTA